MNWLERLTSPRQQQTSMSFEQLCVDHERITQEKEDLHALAWMLPGVFPAQIQSVDKHSQQLTVQYSIHLSYAAESPFRRDLVQISRFVHWKYVLCCPEVVSPFFSLHSETDHISLRLPLSVYAQWESEIFKTLPTIVDRELDGAEDL